MRSRRLGRTGLVVSEIGFGCAPVGIPNYLREWNPGDVDSTENFQRTVDRAIELGYTLFDTAPAYGSGRGEEILGAALRGNRQRAVLATKTGWRGLHERDIFASIDASLRRLQTETIDILQIHGNYEDVFRAEDVRAIVNDGVLSAYQKAREQGKIRFIGVTCEYPLSLVPLVETGHFDIVQTKYNLAYQDAYHHLLPLCERTGTGVLVMRPNTSGVLQKYLRAVAGAKAGDMDIDALAINYVLSDRRVGSALVGMRSLRSVEANARISDDESMRVDVDWLHERNVDAKPRPWVAP